MQLHEIHKDHKHASVRLKVILLIFAVILVGALGYFVWDFQNIPDTTDYSSPVITKKADVTTEKVNEPAEWKTYTNTLLGFSVDYPNGSDVYTLSGEGPNASTISATKTSDSVFISTSGEVSGKFYVAGGGKVALTENYIKSGFATAPDNIVVSKVEVGGVSGYKAVIANDSTVVSTFYRVLNKDGEVINITVINNDDVASSVFDSFKILLDNPFSIDDANIGMTISGTEMKVTKVVKHETLDEGEVFFSGNGMVTAEYVYHDEGMLQNTLCFNSPATQNKKIALPLLVDDIRSLWFCVTDLTDTTIKKGETGTATIEVSDFRIRFFGADVTNQAKLVKVVSKN